MKEHDIIVRLYQNASVFLNDAVFHFNQGMSHHNNRILTIVTLQMALELAIKVKISQDYGVTTILESSGVAITTDVIVRDYGNNKLRAKEFEQVKNFLKSKREYNETFADEYGYMERFQKYRNRLVHFDYSFSEQELKDIENDVIHIIVYIVHALLSGSVTDDEYRKFVFEILDSGEYKKLLQNSGYREELNKLIVQEYGQCHKCPLCDQELLTPHMKCLGCLMNLRDRNIYGYARCGFCKQQTVIYDRLNLSENQTMRGLCVCCGVDTVVYECKSCGHVTNLEDFLEGDCSPGFCAACDLDE